MSLFLLAGGRPDWTPREPVLNGIRKPAPRSSGNAPIVKARLVACAAVDCDREFRKRNPTHVTCSAACAHRIRRKARDE